MANADLYPGAEYRPLADGEPPAISQWDIICLHTMAGYLWGTDSYFRNEGWSGTESHFGIGGSWDGSDDDGRILQWVPCDRKADANLDGNWHVLSVETSDGAKSGPPAWTTKQLESIAQVCAWMCERYNIPAELIPDTAKGRRGIGYHRQGIDPWRVSGGEKWSNSQGKVCPGDARVNQIPGIVTRVREIMSLPPGTTPPPTTTPPVSSGTFSLAFDGGGKMTLRMVKKVSPNMTGTDIRSWQRLLSDRGYSPGTVDGIWGGNSNTALRNFQKAKGLTVDGVLGPTSGERLLEG